MLQNIIIKTRAEVNEWENRKVIEKISKNKSIFKIKLIGFLLTNEKNKSKYANYLYQEWYVISLKSLLILRG